MAIVTPTDRSKSVRYGCVIEVFGGVFVLSCCVLDLSLVLGLCHTTESGLFLFLFLYTCKFSMVMHFVLILHKRYAQHSSQTSFYVFSYDKTS